MWLEDDVNASLSCVLASGRERCANFRRMVAVIVDDTNAVGFATKLKSAIDSAELLERSADLISRNIQPGRDRDRGSRIQHVVLAGDMKFEWAETLSLEGHVKSAADIETMLIELNLAEVEIASLLHAVSHYATTNARQDLAQIVIVVTTDHGSIKRHAIHELDVGVFD